MNILKSIGAILAGFIAIFILSSFTDVFFESTGIFPSVEEQMKSGFTEGWMQALTLFYRFVYLVVGGYVTAKLAPHKPLRHVLILATLGTIVGILGVLAAPKGVLPLWYLIMLIVMGFPGIWLGAKLKT